jgi:hypothetical protein
MGPGQTRAPRCTGPRCALARWSVAGTAAFSATAFGAAAFGAAAFGALLIAACGAAPTSPTASTATSPPPGALSAPDRSTLAKRYLAIALPANRQLDADFDGFHDNTHDDVAAARADLRAAAATERQFDHRLLRISLPADSEVIARLVVTANESRARLTRPRARHRLLSCAVTRTG